MLNDKEIFKKIINSHIQNNDDLSEKVISIYLYGSFATGETNKDSDIDCYFIADNIDIELLQKIENIKNQMESKLNREVFVNVISYDDFSSENLENNFFAHRERPYLFLFEFKTNFELLYGRNLIEEINFPTFFDKKLKEECIRLIRNFRYMNYKLLTNRETKLYSKEAVFKNILFVSKIFEIFHQNKFKNYKDSALFIFDNLKNDLVIEAYGYVKENKKIEENKEKILANSIDFYNQLLESVQSRVVPKKMTSGCIKHESVKAYFSAEKLILDDNKNIPAVVFLNGMPRPSRIEEVADYFNQKGFIFFNAYYPGYWEGDGEMDFSKLPKQISSLGRFIKKGKFKNLFSGVDLDLSIDKLYLIGSSFGATVALDVEDSVFDKIVAVSPLVNFKSHKEVIDDLFGKFDFFNTAIRLKGTKEQAEQSFYELDPLNNKNRIQLNKVLLISDKGDSQIKFSDVEKFSNDKNFKLIPTNFNHHGYRILKYDDIRERLMFFLNK